jgi:hypothetical protein
VPLEEPDPPPDVGPEPPPALEPDPPPEWLLVWCGDASWRAESSGIE